MTRQRFVGIDVSAKTLVVAMSDAAERSTFANDAAGHRTLVRFVTKGCVSARVCLEATGVYHLDLALALHRAKRVELSVLNPAAARDFARALRTRAKTDGVDAECLREFAERMAFVAWQPPTQNAFDLRAIVRRISRLIENGVQEGNRGHAASACRELTPAIAEDIAAHLEQLEERIARLEAHALALAKSDSLLARRYALLVSIPGLAKRSALRVLGELAVLPADMTDRQWVSHAGLDPRPVQSGSSVQRPTRISKTGNPHLRAALFMPALVAVRNDPHIQTFYDQLLARGLKPIAALTAVARKLLHAIHGMWKHNAEFDGKKFRVLDA